MAATGLRRPAAGEGPTFRDRLHARLAARARPASGFLAQPEPRSIGREARGRQLLAGNLLFAGHLVEAPGVPPWDLAPPDAAWTAELHGFEWLDDLAAVGTPAARDLAQDWTFAWVLRFGRGRGPGWTPALAGRRLIRWTHHAILLLAGRGEADQKAFLAALAAQAAFVSRRWRAAAPGLPRFEALTGLLHAALSLGGVASRASFAPDALARSCEREIGPDGGLATRSPEDLSEVLTLLGWAAEAMEVAGRGCPLPVTRAMERIAPALRALRHADGTLARFHGGGQGVEGRLDAALAASPACGRLAEGAAMGFRRLAAGRTVLIADAARPPTGATGAEGHASTAAVEVSSGRRQLIVSCGAGRGFGRDWRRAARATASHSVLMIEGESSARVARPGPGGRAPLEGGPREVRAVAAAGTLEVAHDGWRSRFGLTHARQLRMDQDGRRVDGADSFVTLDDADRAVLARALRRAGADGLVWALRFHLHPDTDAFAGDAGETAFLTLPSGEAWTFGHDAPVALTIEPSVFLEAGRLRPRASRQVVLRGVLGQAGLRVGWRLEKARDMPDFFRDLR